MLNKLKKWLFPTQDDFKSQMSEKNNLVQEATPLQKKVVVVKAKTKKAPAKKAPAKKAPAKKTTPKKTTKKK